MPGAGRRAPARAAHSLAQRLREPLALDPQRHRRRLAARQHERVDPVEVARRRAPRAPPRRAPRSILPCASKSPWRASTPTDRGSWRATSRAVRAAARRAACGTRGSPSRRRGPRRRRRRARGRRSWSSRRRSPRARAAGSSDLKMPEPTNTPSAPSCITSEASAGVAIPPAQNITTGRRPSRATERTSSSGAASSFAALASSSSRSAVQAADLAADRPQVADRLDDVAGARPRPWSGSSPRPRRSAAAPRRGSSRRTRTAP